MKSMNIHPKIRADLDLAVIAAAPALKLGQEHDALRHVQVFLDRFGYLASPAVARGVLDAVTTEALAKFQHFHHLEQTGELDPVTRDVMARPRMCAHADLDRGLPFAVACPLDCLSLTFAFANSTADIPDRQEFDAVRRAFGTWAATGHFHFREVLQHGDPDILVKWIGPDTTQDHLDSDAIAHSDYPPRCAIFSRPHPLHFNDVFVNWGLQGVLPYRWDVETVAVHEIGHLVGLQHSGVDGSVMNSASAYSRGGEVRALHADDLAALVNLYGIAPGGAASAIVVASRTHLGKKPNDLQGNFAGRAEDFRFSTPRVDCTKEAVMWFQVRDVSHEANKLLVNGFPIAGGIPRTEGTWWAGQVMLIPADVLKAGGNVLHIESLNGSGGTDGDVDEFVIDNVVVMYSTIVPGLDPTVPPRLRGSPL